MSSTSQTSQNCKPDEKSVEQKATLSSESKQDTKEQLAEEEETETNNEEVAEEEEEEEDDDEDDLPAGKVESDVQLGFLDQPIHPVQLLRHYFPSKAGGKPAWLNPVHLPKISDLTCSLCQSVMIFLLQLYAPLRKSGKGSSAETFHRALYVFTCPNSTCQGKQGSVAVFRSQLPRVNTYYPSEAPAEPEEYEIDDDKDLPVMEDSKHQAGPSLCDVCGISGPLQCSRCHAANYCGRAHQLWHWKYGGHKSNCQAPDSSSTSSKSVADKMSALTITDHPKTFPNIAQFKYMKEVPACLLPSHEIIIEYEVLNQDDYSKEQKLLSAYEKMKKEEAERGEDEEDDEEDLKSWATPKVKDNAFQKFKRRIDANPDQIIRYDRDHGTGPLFVSSFHQPKPEEIPTCTHCQASCIFEFQILPQFLFLVGGSVAASLDFGTIIVYTCSKSCGNGQQQYFKEFAWVQPHTEDVGDKLNKAPPSNAQQQQ